MCGLQAQGWGGGSPGWKQKVNVSLCPCMAVACDESVMFPLWASVSPSVQCGRGTISPHIQPRGSWVLWRLLCLSSDCPVSLLPSAIPSCVCLCSVEHSLLIAEWPNSNPNPETGCSTPEACRWEVVSCWALPSCTWEHCPPPLPTGPAFHSSVRQTIPATFLHHLQPLLQDPPQICGAREVPGPQGQSQ